jgi:hypothetical protein
MVKQMSKVADPADASLSTRLRERSPRSLKQVASKEPLPGRVASKKSSSGPSSPVVVIPSARREAISTASVERYFPYLALSALFLLLVWYFFLSSSAPTSALNASSSAELSALVSQQLRELQIVVSLKSDLSEVSSLVERQRRETNALRDSLLARIEEEKVKVAADAKDLAARLTKLSENSVSLAQIDAKIASQSAELESKLRFPTDAIEKIVKTHVAALEKVLLEKTESFAQVGLKPPAERKKDYALDVVASSPTFNDYGAFAKYAIKV